jgi:hypothetical protein
LLSKEENAVKMYAQLLSDISDDEYYDSWQISTDCNV